MVYHKRLSITSTGDAASGVCSELLSAVEAAGFGKEAVFGIHLAIEEAVTNAVKHGNGLDLDKHVRIECVIEEDKFDIVVTDEGEGFSPCAVPDPRDAENLEKPSGRGVLLMKSYMDVVEFNEKGNRVHMVKYKRKE